MGVEMVRIIVWDVWNQTCGLEIKKVRVGSAPFFVYNYPLQYSATSVPNYTGIPDNKIFYL